MGIEKLVTFFFSFFSPQSGWFRVLPLTHFHLSDIRYRLLPSQSCLVPHKCCALRRCTSFGISVRKARTLKAGLVTDYVKDGNDRKSDSGLASLLVLGTLAVAASEPLAVDEYMLYLSVQC